MHVKWKIETSVGLFGRWELTTCVRHIKDRIDDSQK